MNRGNTFLKMMSKIDNTLLGHEALRENLTRYEFLALSIVLNARQFSHICSSEAKDTFMFAKSLNKLFDIDPGKYLMIEQKEFQSIVSALHDNNFLSAIYQGIMAPLSNKVSEREAHSILGLLIGTAMDSKTLIRTSLVDIFKENAHRSSVSEGMIAILIGDIECEDAIKSFC